MQRSRFIRAVSAFAVVAAGLPLAGCGGGGGSGGTAGPTPAPPSPAPPPAPLARTFAYVANNASSDISVYEMAETGALTFVEATVVGAGPRFVSIHPSGRFAYVAKDDNTISVHKIASSGKLEAEASLITVDEPEQVYFHPSGNIAYVPEFGTASVLIFRVDAETGGLSSPHSLALSPLLIRSIGIDPRGRFVYIVTSDGNVSSYSVDPDSGGLALRSTVATGAFAGQVVVAPFGGSLYVERGTAISTHAIDGDGVLGAATSAQGDNVRSIAIDTAGRFLFAAGAWDPIVSDITAYAIGASGTLSRGEITPTGGGLERSMTISPSGRFILMTRLDNNTVRAFEVHQFTGALTELAPSLETGSEPVSVTVFSVG